VSGVFENQSAAVVQVDHRCLPSWTLIDAVWIRIEGLPGTVEPIEVRFVVGNPLLDRLPGRIDGLHGFDIEGWRRRAGELDDALPQSVEAEEEFDFLATDDLAAILPDIFQRIPLPRCLGLVMVPL